MRCKLRNAPSECSKSECEVKRSVHHENVVKDIETLKMYVSGERIEPVFFTPQCRELFDLIFKMYQKETKLKSRVENLERDFHKLVEYASEKAIEPGFLTQNGGILFNAILGLFEKLLESEISRDRAERELAQIKKSASAPRSTDFSTAQLVEEFSMYIDIIRSNKTVSEMLDKLRSELGAESEKSKSKDAEISALREANDRLKKDIEIARGLYKRANSSSVSDISHRELSTVMNVLHEQRRTLNRISEKPTVAAKRLKYIEDKISNIVGFKIKD